MAAPAGPHPISSAGFPLPREHGQNHPAPPRRFRSILVEAFMQNALRRFVFALVALAFAAGFSRPLVAQGAPTQTAAGQPYTIEYYYKCQWGHQQEFLNLFLKNHWPLLKKIQSTGRILSVKIEQPAYHTSEELRWDYRVTIVYKNSTVATTANPDEEAMIKELWPDQATYKQEEQRRFEILLGHIDLPVTDVTPK
jgi:hypothetical protein